MEAFQLFQQIQESRGLRIFWKMEELRAAHAIFDGNFRELLDKIRWFEDANVSRQLGSPDRNEQQHEIHREMFRLVHNFLAGAATLIDHTRVMVAELYADAPFKPEYEAKVREIFGSNSVSAFVKGLRNWMVHKGAVPLAIVTTLNLDETTSSRFMLIVRDLKIWSGWKADAKTFLASAPGDLNLADLVIEYSDLVKVFSDWLVSRLNEIHADDFNEVASLRKLYGSLRGSGKDFL